MADKFTPITEEDKIESGQINTLFSTIQTEINDLPLTSIQPNSLHDAHLPSLVVDAGTTTFTSASAHTYTNRYPGWTSDTYAGTGTNDTGWAIINTAGQAASGTDLEVDLGANYYISGLNAGILVLFNTNVFELDDTATATGTNKLYALFKIQVYTNSTWRSIPRTERYTTAEMRYGPGDDGSLVSPQVTLSKDVAIRTLISAADLAATTHAVSKVRVLTCVSRKLWPMRGSLSLKQSNLSAMILHASLQESL